MLGFCWTHPEVSTDERSFSKGWSNTTSLFCRIRDSSWTDTSLSYLLASALINWPISHITAGTGATLSLLALPWSSSRAKEFLGLQKRSGLRKKVAITIFKVFNLLLHFQRYAICILSVLMNVRHLKGDLVEDEHVERFEKKYLDNSPVVRMQVPRKENLFFTYLEYLWAWIQTCAVYAFDMREGKTIKQTNQPTNPKPTNPKTSQTPLLG